MSRSRYFTHKNDYITMLLALRKIAALDPHLYTKDGYSEWNVIEYFNKAQQIAKDTLKIFEIEDE